LRAESTKPAGATAGSNPVAPTYGEPLCIKGSFLVCLNFSTLIFARCQDYVKIFGGILRKTHPSLLAVPWKRHPSALSDVDIQSEIDVLRVLFLLEEKYHMKIERTEDQTTLTFDNHDPSMDGLNSLLYAWHVQNKTLNAGQKKSADPGAEEHKYDVWKSRFPMDLEQYWDEQHRKLEEYYQALIKKASKSYKKVTVLSEFLTHIREMIQAGIHIKADQQLIRLGKGALTLTALVSEVYAPENRAVTEAVSHFLFDLKTLTDYGMNFDVNYYENEQGTRITIILHLSPLMAFDSTINSMQEYESGNPHGNYESEIFEKNLDAELTRYDINLQDEIEHSN